MTDVECDKNMFVFWMSVANKVANKSILFITALIRITCNIY